MSNDLLCWNNKKVTDLERLQADLARSDHVLFLAVDAIVAVHAAFRRWRDRRRTRRALAELNDQELRDIGLEREEIVLAPPAWSWAGERSYRALTRLDDAQISNLSDVGRRLRKEAQHRLKAHVSRSERR